MGITDLLPWRRTALARTQHSGVGGTVSGLDGPRAWGVLGGLLPGTDTNWAQVVRDPTANAVVNACIRWTVDNVAEPELKVYRKTGRASEEKEDDLHPALDLLNNPNPDYDGKSLIQAAATDFMFGDGYILKERDNVGRVRALWWKPAWCVWPVWPSDGSEFCTGYIYRPGGRGTTGIHYAKEDVIHFRWSLDGGTEGRFGRQRIHPVLREIATLNEASNYHAALLKNVGVVSYLLSAKDGQTVTPESALSLKEWWKRFTRDGRGEPAVPSVPIEATRLGLSPEEMALDKILRNPQMAICGAWGISPAVVFLANDPKGLDNGGQHRAARVQTYDDFLVPLCKRMAEELTRSLLFEFSESEVRTRRTRIAFDFENVQALAEDEDIKHTRLREDYKVGGIDRYEFREATGYRPREEDKGVYFAGPEKDEADHERGEESAEAAHERAKELTEGGEGAYGRGR